MFNVQYPTFEVLPGTLSAWGLVEGRTSFGSLSMFNELNQNTLKQPVLRTQRRLGPYR